MCKYNSKPVCFSETKTNFVERKSFSTNRNLQAAGNYGVGAGVDVSGTPDAGGIGAGVANVGADESGIA